MMVTQMDNKPNRAKIIFCAFMGALFLGIGLFSLIGRLAFLQTSSQFNASIVESVREEVRKGKRSYLAYVPIVEILDEKGMSTKVKVKTYNEVDIYRTGGKLDVLYAPYGECVPNTFSDLWSDIIFQLGFSILSFFPLIYYQFLYKPKANGQ
jgi:hypothetical protein